jgi:mannose-6-phosphate isomerase-like protein (cupin superfamily)
MEAQVFHYTTPENDFERGRKLTKLCQTDRLVGVVQLIKRGGENRLHSHEHLDGLWMVLSGRARFHGENDTILGEFGKYEGVLVPRGFKYWFESASDDEPLELLQVEASDVSTERFYGTAANIVEEGDARVAPAAS